MKTTILLGLLLISLVRASAFGQRAAMPLDDGWKFIKQDVAADAPFQAWETVQVPHTWNARDGQEGKALHPEFEWGYYRGPAWYAKELTLPPEWKEKRVFVRFEAASLVAKVYLNGQPVGEHRGGFSAFCLDLTPYLRGEGTNVLRVRVDNTRDENIIPLSADFSFFGGLYRPVQLIATDKLCITPLDHATSGVYLRQQAVNSASAEVEAETKISNPSDQPQQAAVRVTVSDREGGVVTKADLKTKLPPRVTTSVRQKLAIQKPHLWNGRSDPYLYSVKVELLRNGSPVDAVTQQLGLRTVRIDPKLGFLLNEKPYPVRGVNRHQDYPDKGWALTNADHEDDLRIILEMGATAVRLAHYQQSAYVHELCDRNGLLLWEEIPLVERVVATPEFEENTRQQLVEMILQGFNNPSLCFWGLFNELNAPWVKEKGAPAKPLLEKLRATAKALDTSRPLVAASWRPDPDDFYCVADWMAFNNYPGWYWGLPGDMNQVVDKGSATLGGGKICLSEYGAGGNIDHHEEGEPAKPKTSGPWHPEEWQARVHEADWEQIKADDRVWGSFVWVMFDFASARRNEGSLPGVNDKGLVTRDRKVKKDSFHFLQANWTEKPMVYIASRRMTPRKLATTEIKIYSNCADVQLSVNGQPLGKGERNSVNVWRWKDVGLQPGLNRIEAVGKSGGETVRDACEWELKPE